MFKVNVHALARLSKIELECIINPKREIKMKFTLSYLSRISNLISFVYNRIGIFQNWSGFWKETGTIW